MVSQATLSLDTTYSLVLVVSLKKNTDKDRGESEGEE